MKKLSDYQGEEAIILWGKLLEEFTSIFTDEEIINAFKSKKPALFIAKLIVEKKPTEACNVLLAIDDTPINGLNLMSRLAGVVLEMINDEDIASFFGLSAEEKKDKIPIGSATENIEEKESQDISSNT